MRTEQQPRKAASTSPATSGARTPTRGCWRVQLLTWMVAAIAAVAMMGDVAAAQNTDPDGQETTDFGTTLTSDSGEVDNRYKNVRIEIFNDCYQVNDDGTVTSYFGYELTTPSTVHMQAGSKYNFLTEIAENSGQPSTFKRGLHPLAFSITYPSSSVPVWTLNNQQARADESGERCKEAPAVPEFPMALVGPTVVLLAFGIWFRRNKDDSLDVPTEA